MKKAIAILLIAILLIVCRKEAWASFEKINQENNKFGIHLAVVSDEDLQDAASLVNSSGGDWGYITVVIQEDDRNPQKWQAAFDRMRELHLIPIVRLATFLEGTNWRAPKSEDAKSWAEFLDFLNWVVKNRYVVLFNEPNHAAEWGGKVNSAEYGQVALEFAKKLKEKNPDFFIMLAGLDAAAPNLPPYFEDEAVFLRQLPQETFNQVDGWASHSYPLRGLVGRNSLSTYQWELFLLRQLGVTKSLPVFITETGWPHQEGIKFRKEYLPQDKVAENFRILFNQLLYDPQVVAVTPFLLNYQSDLFDQFSWRKPHSREFYSQYALTQQLAKTKGQPIQAQKLAINSQLPQKLMAHSTYQIPILVRNQGQAIWDQKEHYSLRLIGANKDWEYFFSDFTNLRPFEEQTIFLYLKTGGELGKYDLRFAIAKDNQIVSDEINWALEISSMVQISFEINLFPKIKTQGENFRILIYDPQERVIFEKDNLGVKNGQGVIEEVRNLVFGQKYRLVILKPYYLPGQKLLTIEDRGNRVVFKFMFPLDYDQDGKFSLADILALLQKPQLISLWWPL